MCETAIGEIAARAADWWLPGAFADRLGDQYVGNNGDGQDGRDGNRQVSG